MCLSIPCEAAHPHGRASASICVTSPKNNGHSSKLQNQTMIPHARVAGALEEQRAGIVASLKGLAVVGFKRRAPIDPFVFATEASSSLWKNCRQFLGRNNFKLGVGTIAELFVRSPSSELCRVTEAISLHVIISNFYN